MAEGREVWVFVERDECDIAPVSLELLTKARQLADELDGCVCGLVMGHELGDVPQRVVQQGADVVLLADDEQLELYRTLPYARVATTLVRERKPYIFLLGATPVGRDLAPRIASAERAGLTADCTSLRIGDFERKGEKHEELLYQVRPAFGGNVIATIVNPEHHPQMATVREGVMAQAPPDAAREGKIEKVKVQLEKSDLALSVIDRDVHAPTCNLRGADIVVAGGAGVGCKEGFRLIEELAQVLGAEVGASRAAVDAGYVGQEHQIGQTGVTVRPRLYVACGISGAVQHRAGMDESSKIVAINSDPDAPIFQIAHYKIVGDLNEVVPWMIEVYRGKGK
jgi:electron transfer flavoprotein alpha subunit